MDVFPICFVDKMALAAFEVTKANSSLQSSAPTVNDPTSNILTLLENAWTSWANEAREAAEGRSWLCSTAEINDIRTKVK